MIYDLFFGFMLFVFTASTFFAGAAANEEKDSEGRFSARLLFTSVTIILFLIFLIVGVRT